VQDELPSSCILPSVYR